MWNYDQTPICRDHTKQINGITLDRLSYFKKSLPDKLVYERTIINNHENINDTFCDHALKANQHSLLALFNNRVEGEDSHITLFDLQLEGDSYQPRERHIRCPQFKQLKQKYVDIWEFRQDQFMLVPDRLTKQQLILIFDWKNNSFRSFSCPFSPYYASTVIFLKQFVCIVEGNSHPVGYNQGPDTLHFVGYDSEKVEFVSRKQDLLSRKYAVSCLNSSVLVETVFGHDNRAVEVIEWKTNRWMDVSLHLLLHLNEDFDDDLLSDALGLLF